MSARKFEYTHIKPIRQLRGLTQEAFANKCQLDKSTLGKVERGELTLSPIYYERINAGFRRIRVSNFEIESVKRMVDIRLKLGYSK